MLCVMQSNAVCAMQSNARRALERSQLRTFAWTEVSVDQANSEHQQWILGAGVAVFWRLANCLRNWSCNAFRRTPSAAQAAMRSSCTTTKAAMCESVCNLAAERAQQVKSQLAQERTKNIQLRAALQRTLPEQWKLQAPVAWHWIHWLSMTTDWQQQQRSTSHAVRMCMRLRLGQWRRKRLVGVQDRMQRLQKAVADRDATWSASVLETLPSLRARIPICAQQKAVMVQNDSPYNDSLDNESPYIESPSPAGRTVADEIAYLEAVLVKKRTERKLVHNKRIEKLFHLQ